MHVLVHMRVVLLQSCHGLVHLAGMTVNEHLSMPDGKLPGHDCCGEDENRDAAEGAA